MDDEHNTEINTMPNLSLMCKKNKHRHLMIFFDGVGLFIMLFFTWMLIIKLLFFNELIVPYIGLCLTMLIVITYVSLLCVIN